MSTITLELPDELAAAVGTPEGMKRVRQMIEAEFGANLTAFAPHVAKNGKQNLEETIENLKALPFPVGIVLDDSRDSYYTDENGTLRGADGFGQ